MVNAWKNLDVKTDCLVASFIICTEQKIKRTDEQNILGCLRYIWKYYSNKDKG